MIHQHHPFSAGTQQVIPCQHAGDLFVFIQNGIAGVAVFEHLLPHLVHPIIQVEAHQLTGGADPSHRGRLEDQPCSTVGIVGGGDDAGPGFHLPQLLVQLSLTYHQTAHIHRKRPTDHIRLVTADHNGISALKQQVFPTLGQGNGNLTADGIGVFTGLVENFTLQHGKDIEQGYLLQKAGGDLLHIVPCHILTAEDAVKRAVLVGNGDGVHIFLG